MPESERCFIDPFEDLVREIREHERKLNKAIKQLNGKTRSLIEVSVADNQTINIDIKRIY